MVTIFREAGSNPLTIETLEAAQEMMTIKASSEYDAYLLAQLESELKFCGQVKRTYINGKEFLNPRI